LINHVTQVTALLFSNAKVPCTIKETSMIINDPYYYNDAQKTDKYDKVTFIFDALVIVMGFSLLSFLLHFS